MVTLYLTRNKDGTLFLHKDNKLYKSDNRWVSLMSHAQRMSLPQQEFPQVKWEDEKPTEVRLMSVLESYYHNASLGESILIDE